MNRKNQNFIHDLSDCKSKKIGINTNIWQYCAILKGAKIGDNCNICSHCFIENDVKVGNNVTIKNGVQLWDGISIEDNVFIGPNVSFTNDLLPSSKNHQEKVRRTLIEKNVSIGAGASILPGIKIGQGATIGAGAVITRSVDPFVTVIGNPQTTIGFKSRSPKKLKPFTKGSKNFSLKRNFDKRGELVSAESLKDVPFEFKRIFYISKVMPQFNRGSHAHIKCKQFIICIQGSLNVACDDGNHHSIHKLDSSSEGLYVPEMTWNVLYNFSNDCLLVVLASDKYLKNDYITNYDQFIKMIS